MPEGKVGFLADVTSPGAIAISSGFIALGVLVGSPGLWETDLVYRLLAIAAALCLMYALVLLGRVALGARFTTHTPAQVGVVVLSTALFASALGTMYRLMGIDPNPGWTHLIPTSSILATTILLVVGAQARAIREHRERLESLTIELALVTSAQAELTASRATWQRQARADVTSIVEQALADLPGDDAVACAKTFRALAIEVIRPMSHELAQERVIARPAPIPQSRVARWQILELAAGARIPPVFFTIALVVLALTLGFALFEPLHAIALGLIIGTSALVTALASGSLAVRLAHRSPVTRLLAKATTLIIGGLLGLLLALTLIDPVAFASSLVLALPAFVVVGFALSMDAGARRARQELEAHTAAAVEHSTWLLARHNAEHYAERRELAQAIHGPLQGALTAAEIRIRMAGSHGGHQAVLQAEADVREALDNLCERTHPKLSVVLDRLTAMWTLLCHLDVDINSGTLTLVDSDPTASQAIADVLTNAVTDSVRHGGAQHVTIRLTIDGDVAILDVTDSGTSAKLTRPAGAAGLGSSTLDQVCLSWSRDQTAEGTHLSARIPHSHRR